MSIIEAKNNLSLPDDLAVVYFGNQWFAENRTSSHHIARLLAERYPLLYVESPGLRAPRVDTRDLTKIFRKLDEARALPTPVSDNVWLSTIPQIPFRRLPLVKTVNRTVGAMLLRRALRHLGFRHYITWFTTPDAAEMAGQIGEDLVVYYVTDHYALFPGVDAKQIARLDEKLTRCADQVFVSSPTLLESKRRINENSCHAPHGVDSHYFAQASLQETSIAQGAAGLPRPIIGFYGLIEAWIDLDLIETIARRRPDWTFLMIGRLAVRAGAVADLPNVHFPGPQPYETLVNWSRAFDVAIIPYRSGFQVMNASSLKLREYLASGKPIVATPTPEIEQYRPMVRVADSADGFLSAIEDALNHDTPADCALRQQAMSDSSWSSRVENLLSILAQRQPRRSTGSRQPVR